MENNIKQGDKVVCISDHFPHLKEHGGKDTKYKPRVGEILIVDEVLGHFLRFDAYDTDDSHNWFFFNRFQKIGKAEIEEMEKDYKEQSIREYYIQLKEESKNFGGL